MTLEKDDRVEIRAVASDVKRWRAAADVEGMPLSLWIRRLCNQAAPKKGK